MPPSLVDRVLSFWFEEGTVPGFCEFRPVWFDRSADFDAAIGERFRSDAEAAAADRLDHLAETAPGALALVILLDQFPRNLFRGDGRAFASDAKALAVARRAIEVGHDRELAPLRRLFLYLPFQHSEDLEDQRLSVRLFESLGEDQMFDFIRDAARRHLDIIERFGRYPHRNAALGRASNEAEQRFLASDEGRFWTV